MSAGFAVIVGAVAGFIAHFVGKGSDMGPLSIVLVALGVFIGWAAGAFLGIGGR